MVIMFSSPARPPNNSITEKGEPTPNALPTGWEERSSRRFCPNLITSFKRRMVNTVLVDRPQFRMVAVSVPSVAGLSAPACSQSLEYTYPLP